MTWTDRTESTDSWLTRSGDNITFEESGIPFDSFDISFDGLAISDTWSDRSEGSDTWNDRS